MREQRHWVRCEVRDRVEWRVWVREGQRGMGEGCCKRREQRVVRFKRQTRQTQQELKRDKGT